jgi:hypothetical protein
MRRIILGLLAFSAAATTLQAQTAPLPSIVLRSSTSKVFFSSALNGSLIDVEERDGTDSGAGLMFGVGYGFTSNFAMFVEATGANLRSDAPDDGLFHFDFGARYHFANPTSELIPFLDAALTGRVVSQDDAPFCEIGGCQVGALDMSGVGFTFGGGVMYFATPTFALNGALKATVGEFTDVSFDNVTVSGFELDATTWRLNLGVVWFPRR